MPAPIAKGIIVVASVLVAASIALYESPQVRVWVDSSRRKIALAFHHLGDEINPSSRSQRDSEDEEIPSEEQRVWRREEFIRRHRAELIRRAREEGVAVDLDELDAVGRDSHSGKRPSPSARGRSFDDLVGSNGMLREKEAGASITMATAIDRFEEGLHRRGQGTQDIASGAFVANPFDDDTHNLFCHDEDEKRALNHFNISRESSSTVHDIASVPSVQHPVLSPLSPILIPIDQMTDASFHSAAGDFELAGADDVHSNGTLTPTEGGFSTSVSVAGSNNDDIGVLSDILSQAGLSEADSSDASFSDVGTSTPGSWTDVGSDAGSDGGFGHISQQH